MGCGRPDASWRGENSRQVVGGQLSRSLTRRGLGPELGDDGGGQQLIELGDPGFQQLEASLRIDGSKSVSTKDGDNKNLLLRSTAAYSQCGWRAWLNGTTITAGMNNIFDRSPPFGAGTPIVGRSS